MSKLFKLYQSNYKINNILLLGIFYAISIMLIRVKITHSIYLLFLIWNLFLACIPYIISSYLKNYPSSNKWLKWMLLFIWLTFIPNSFYLLTDFIHLNKNSESIYYLDLVIIALYSFLGFVLGIISILEIEKLEILNKYQFLNNFSIPILSFLIGYGVYIGRELRYNSWDLIKNPIQLVSDLIFEITYIETISFSIAFGSLVYISIIISKNLIDKTQFQ